MNLLFEPHADDCALFAAFSAIRQRPTVVTCFPSSGDYGDTGIRHSETIAAMAILGAGPVEQWDGQDLQSKMHDIDDRLIPMRVFAPSTVCSHPDHLATARAAAAVWGDRLTRYHTYMRQLPHVPDELLTRADLELVKYHGPGKVRDGDLVPFEPGWTDLKRRALACYKTQLAHPRARAFFEMDLAEYVEP